MWVKFSHGETVTPTRWVFKDRLITSGIPASKIGLAADLGWELTGNGEAVGRKSCGTPGSLESFQRHRLGFSRKRSHGSANQ